MSNWRQIIPATGLLATMAVAAYMVTELSGQETATGNFTSAATAEVRDGQGQVVLRGQFGPGDEDDDDAERKAVLEPTGIDADAAGEAEVEFAKTGATEQEIEFSIRNVAANTSFTFVIDGVDVATATSDRRGRAEVELEIPMPVAGGAR